MPSQDTIPDDDEVRHTYNFAPGNYGLVYRANAPDTGAPSQEEPTETNHSNDAETTQPTQTTQTVDGTQETEIGSTPSSQGADPVQYKIQAMKWGLVPFWTKRNPDLGSMMRTINCRDDSLMRNGGMWNTMKHKKRCVVVAQGFYEWLKKNDGKEKLPHFVKRKDGKMMCFAGLWDCCKFEDSEESLYTYTIVTTQSNQQLGFLHDRMPVILNNGSSDMFKWLDARNSEWTPELQSLLKSYAGELDCYPVSKEVGKVGNNSPKFVVPIDSAENKQNIANFFGSSQQKPATRNESPLKTEEAILEQKAQAIGLKRDHDEAEDPLAEKENQTSNKASKLAVESTASTAPSTTDASSESPSKTSQNGTITTRSATSNSPLSKARESPSKAAGGSKKITSFFGCY